MNTRSVSRLTTAPRHEVEVHQHFRLREMLAVVPERVGYRAAARGGAGGGHCPRDARPGAGQPRAVVADDAHRASRAGVAAALGDEGPARAGLARRVDLEGVCAGMG